MSAKKPSRARRLALQGLCCLDAQGRKAMDLVHAFIEDSRDNPETIRAARDLLVEAYGRLETYDAALRRHARNWDLARLALVDRNILRLAAHEMFEGLAPPKVVLNEAIRLAKEFSTAESPRFVNGVLDAVAREIRDQTAREPR